MPRDYKLVAGYIARETYFAFVFSFARLSVARERGKGKINARKSRRFMIFFFVFGIRIAPYFISFYFKENYYRIEKNYILIF